MRMKVLSFLIGAAFMVFLGVATPIPWGFPYFALAIILCIIAMKKELWK